MPKFIQDFNPIKKHLNELAMLNKARKIAERAPQFWPVS
jgi:hypothetical protein